MGDPWPGTGCDEAAGGELAPAPDRCQSAVAERPRLNTMEDVVDVEDVVEIWKGSVWAMVSTTT